MGSLWPDLAARFSLHCTERARISTGDGLLHLLLEGTVSCKLEKPADEILTPSLLRGSCFYYEVLCQKIWASKSEVLLFKWEGITFRHLKPSVRACVLSWAYKSKREILLCFYILDFLMFVS